MSIKSVISTLEIVAKLPKLRHQHFKDNPTKHPSSWGSAESHVNKNLRLDSTTKYKGKVVM